MPPDDLTVNNSLQRTGNHTNEPLDMNDMASELPAGQYRREISMAKLMPRIISVEEVRKQSEPWIVQIWENFDQLRKIVGHFEPLIQQRWLKKSAAKREKMLQSAWGSSPPMAKEHRPDVAHIRYPKTRPINRSIFMWPNMNLEDLCKTEPLLLLLNARGRNFPSAFAFTDLSNVTFGLTAGVMALPPILDRWNMQFTGQDSPSRDVSPGEGLWILEIQDRLYKFLVEICKVILHDSDLQGLQLPTHTTEPGPPIPTANNRGDVATTSLMISRYEATYHLPEKLNIQRLQSLIEAKLSEAEDKLWALREDPGVFASTLWDTYQHRLEHIAGPTGKGHPGIKTAEFREHILASTVSYVMNFSMCDVEIWGFLYTHIRSLAALKEKLFDSAGAKPKVEDGLPPELALEFYTFLYHSKEDILEPLLDKVEMKAKLSPPLRHLFRYNHNMSLAETADHRLMIDLERSKLRASSIEVEYLWVLNNMSEPTGRQLIGIHTCVEEFERITSDKQGREFLTPHLAQHFSDICILSECIYQIESFPLWAATSKTAMNSEDTRRQISQAYERKLKPWVSFSVSTDTSYLGAKLAHMKYPVDKYPNKANADAMQAAEAALDTFWERLTIQLRQAGLWNGRVRDVLLSCEPKRTPPWVEPPKKVGTSTENSIANVTGDRGVVKHIQEKEATRIQPTKIKEKTRPSQKPAAEQGIANDVIDAHPPDAKEEQLHPVLKVDKRAMKVFAMLFFQPSNSRSRLPGEIPWTDFLYAMHQVGFAVEKLGGSSWQFSPGPTLERYQYARGIQFHEPHPTSKISFRIARVYGRRLTRAYGWCAETFCDQ